jgi:HNH endonuclease
MAKQKFTTAHRRAIWTAYAMRCFYCRERLRWDDLRIDHVVPESLSNDADALRAKLMELGLPESWDQQANANLVASCDRCNARKRELTPPANQLILWTTETRVKLGTWRRAPGLPRRRPFPWRLSAGEIEARAKSLAASSRLGPYSRRVGFWWCAWPSERKSRSTVIVGGPCFPLLCL